MIAPDPARLAAAIARNAGTPVEIVRVAPLSGGASSATYAVDALRDGAAWPLILQTAAAGDDPAGAIGKAGQARLQHIAGGLGLPVADVVAVLTSDDGLGDGFVMARVAGESLAPKYLRAPEYAAARAALTAQCAAALARLHAAPLTAWDGVALAGGSTAEQRARLGESYRSFGVDVPVFELALAWLAERLPDRPARSLVHGDFRSGNFIVGPDGLRAVLDWELAHLGDRP